MRDKGQLSFRRAEEAQPIRRDWGCVDGVRPVNLTKGEEINNTPLGFKRFEMNFAGLKPEVYPEQG